MSTPETDYEFTGIISRSYTAGEMIDLQDAALAFDKRDGGKPDRQAPFRNFRRGLPKTPPKKDNEEIV